MRIVGIAVAAILAGATAHAATWHVDANAVGPGDGSPSAPFSTIQAAVDVAADGDTVLVAPGEYVENVVVDEDVVVQSTGGALVTRLRTATPGIAFHTLPADDGNAPFPGLRGFTVADSLIGIEDEGFAVIEDCIVTGNDIGVHPDGLLLLRCTVVGNAYGIREGGIGVIALRSIVWGNASSDYFNMSVGSFGIFNDCVGLTTAVNPQASFVNVLFADPFLWDVPVGDFHLRPSSPCIDYVGTDDVGALPHDPAYGATFPDLGGALAGSGGVPALAAAGHMYPTGYVVLSLANGPPAGTAILVLGTSAIHAPLFGGTLVPAPDALVVGLPLDAAGWFAHPALWPAGVPSGTTLILQAWMPDVAGPQGFCATNAIQFTAP